MSNSNEQQTTDAALGEIIMQKTSVIICSSFDSATTAVPSFKFNKFFSCNITTPTFSSLLITNKVSNYLYQVALCNKRKEY